MDILDLSEVPIEEIYQAIGTLIVDALDDNWVTATAYAEIDSDDSGVTYGRYTTRRSTDNSLSFETDFNMYFAFDELRQRLRKPGQPTWNRARFILQRTGKFDLEFDYPEQEAL